MFYYQTKPINKAFIGLEEFTCILSGQCPLDISEHCLYRLIAQDNLFCLCGPGNNPRCFSHRGEEQPGGGGGGAAACQKVRW